MFLFELSAAACQSLMLLCGVTVYSDSLMRLFSCLIPFADPRLED